MLFGAHLPEVMVTRAIVTSNKDPERLGRIQVCYPHYSREAKQTPTNWARLCLPFASEENGVWFIPEIGDEVLVAFESSNISKPIILGSLYGEKNKPPASGKAGDFNEDGKNALNFIKSRSGNLIVLDDSPGKESLELSDAGGGVLRIEKGKIAFGTSAGELFELLEQLLESLSNAAPTLVQTAMGPGVMNPSLLSKIKEVKSKIGQMKGKIG